MNKIRNDQDPPLATGECGWRYHHIGIPVDRPIDSEKYLPEFKFHILLPME